KKGNQEGRLDKFDVTILFNFKNKYTAITNYFIEQKKEPDSFLAGEFSDIAYENNHQFWFTQKGFNGENILIEFVYNEKLKSDPLVYSFGLIYDWIKVEEPEIIPVPLIPAIMKMETWNITEPGIHTLQVETTGENLTFYTEPDILPIDSKSGLITLDTNEFGNDEYLFYVIAFNEEGIIIESHVYINININPGNYPIIKPIGKLTAKVGEEFHYKVDISNKKEEIYLFTSKSYLFDIDKKTGEINFTPTKEDLGLHSVRVDVENEYGRTWQRWELEVK
ncbi:MAG: hypothetical protein KJ648_07665, partial [Candidatus Omnitrophica bacterium]|nr:hypothetical protein [Candidatus Omnitrophota bacterium]